MTNMKEKELRAGVLRLAGYLDERYILARGFNRNPDEMYYEGLLKAIEVLGGDWRRDEIGKHKVFICGIGGKAKNND
jgi:hypothetical protein